MTKIKITPRDVILATLAFAMVVGTTMTALEFLPRNAEAMPDFQAGRIIDNSVMADYNAMTESEIQRFLESKNPCNDRDIEKVSGFKKVKYHIEDGKFVCLAEEDFDGESAAEIIMAAAREFRISPKVLIVLLEKEQGLVTDTWPNNIQYRSATGFGCPDTAACDEEYYGFKNQVRNAARLFREVLDGGYTNFPLGNTFIRYNPDASCGGTRVEIQNLATSALYRYTPYQPNAAALRAGYGRGDRCSAYGNRNFYRYYHDWFGSPLSGDTQADAQLTVYGENIEEGVYFIRSKVQENMVLDVEGASKEKGVNVQLYPKNGTSAQKFIVKAAGDKYYTVTNINSGKRLDLRKQETGANIHQWEPTNSCEQKWKILSNGSGYEIASSCNDWWRVNAKRVWGKMSPFNINVELRNESMAQRWQLEPTDGAMPDMKEPEAQIPKVNDKKTEEGAEIQEGRYKIISKLDLDLALDIRGASKDGGAKAQIYADNGTGAQEFRVLKGSKAGYWKIINVNSGKVLDVEGAGRWNGTPIQQYWDNGSCAQNWKLVGSGSGYYELVSECSGLVLDVRGASRNWGTPLQLYQSNNTAAQAWKFVRL